MAPLPQGLPGKLPLQPQQAAGWLAAPARAQPRAAVSVQLQLAPARDLWLLLVVLKELLRPGLPPRLRLLLRLPAGGSVGEAPSPAAARVVSGQPSCLELDCLRTGHRTRAPAAVVHSNSINKARPFTARCLRHFTNATAHAKGHMRHFSSTLRLSIACLGRRGLSRCLLHHSVQRLGCWLADLGSSWGWHAGLGSRRWLTGVGSRRRQVVLHMRKGSAAEVAERLEDSL